MTGIFTYSFGREISAVPVGKGLSVPWTLWDISRPFWELVFSVAFTTNLIHAGRHILLPKEIIDEHNSNYPEISKNNDYFTNLYIHFNRNMYLFT